MPFPESVAASEIHKAGQQGSKAAKILFANMGFGGFMYLLGAVNVFIPSNTFPRHHWASRQEAAAAHQHESERRHDDHRRRNHLHRAGRQPAYLGVGYIIGPRLAALNFAGGVLAWGLLVPLLTFTLGPYIQSGAARWTTDLVDPAGRSDLLLHRAADCGRRHAGRRAPTRCSKCASNWAWAWRAPFPI